MNNVFKTLEFFNPKAFEVLKINLRFYDMSIKHAKALAELQLRHTPAIKSFGNGRVYLMGRNTAYAQMRQRGFAWDTRRRQWVKGV
ncbi:MAG: hypothetical protein SF123_09730 [Chloroflexota bacterium]|nr:hypothetical protein [Chloroflexota bacterium]